MCDNHLSLSMGMVATNKEEEANTVLCLGEEDEESGWTSYLETDENSNVFTLSESSAYSCSNNFIDDHTYNYRISICNNINNDGNDNINTMGDDDQIVARNGNAGEEISLLDGSSTLSGASSLGQSTRVSANFKTPINRFCSKLPQNQQKFKRMKKLIHHKFAHAAHLVLQDHLLEDTATSSPLLAAQIIVEEARHNCYLSNGGEGADVSKRFKALEALIPRLKEVAGEANEEEMLNVIISHVRALELKVELLSSVWRLSRLQHE